MAVTAGLQSCIKVITELICFGAFDPSTIEFMTIIADSMHSQEKHFQIFLYQRQGNLSFVLSAILSVFLVMVPSKSAID
jgi:hypothetical protein